MPTEEDTSKSSRVTICFITRVNTDGAGFGVAHKEFDSKKDAEKYLLSLGFTVHPEFTPADGILMRNDHRVLVMWVTHITRITAMLVQKMPPDAEVTQTRWIKE